MKMMLSRRFDLARDSPFLVAQASIRLRDAYMFRLASILAKPCLVMGGVCPSEQSVLGGTPKFPGHGQGRSTPDEGLLRLLGRVSLLARQSLELPVSIGLGSAMLSIRGFMTPEMTSVIQDDTNRRLAGAGVRPLQRRLCKGGFGGRQGAAH